MVGTAVMEDSLRRIKEIISQLIQLLLLSMSKIITLQEVLTHSKLEIESLKKLKKLRKQENDNQIKILF